MKRMMVWAAAFAWTGWAASAATLVWDGSTNAWNTPASWGGTVPDLATPTDEAVVNGGAITWTTSMDFAQNSVFTMNGGSWRQVGVINWIDFGIAGKTGVTALGAGAMFDSGDAGNVFLGRGLGTGILTLDGGSLIVTNNSGAELHIQGPGSRVYLNSGLMDVNLVSFDGDSNCVLHVSGGELRIHNGHIFQGIFRASGAGFVNFTPGSTGSIFIDNLTTGAMGGLLVDGRIRHDEVAVTNLVAVNEGSGIRITLDEPDVTAPASLSGALVSGVIMLVVTDLTLDTTNRIERAADLAGAPWTPVHEFIASGASTNFSEFADGTAAFYRMVTD